MVLKKWGDFSVAVTFWKKGVEEKDWKIVITNKKKPKKKNKEFV